MFLNGKSQKKRKLFVNAGRYVIDKIEKLRGLVQDSYGMERNVTHGKKNRNVGCCPHDNERL